MKFLWSLVLLLSLISPANATTSTINPTLPLQGAPLTSAPVRNNFIAAYNDINNIYTLVGPSGPKPGGISGQIQYNNNGAFGGITTSGDCTISTPSGVISCSGLNGVSFPASPSTNTVPVVTSSNTITYETVPNAALTNSATTVNGVTCTLGSSCTVTATASNINIGTSTITGGTNTKVLFDNSGVVGEYTITGTGNVVMSASPTLTGTTAGANSTWTGQVAVGTTTLNGALNINGTVTATTFAGSGASLTNLPWANITGTPTTLSGYGITSPLPVAQGGTAASSASITALNNITGFSLTGLTGTGNLVASASPTFTGTVVGATSTWSSAVAIGTTTTNGALNVSGTINATAVSSPNGEPLTNLAQIATNTILGNSTSGTANVTALSVGGCSSASSALIWTTNTGFGCNTSITANAVPAANLTGTTLASNVVTSSLTSVATIGTGTWSATAIDATHGGTAQTSWTQGDTLYASASNTLSKLAAGTLGTLLTTGGSSGTPSWNEAASLVYNFIFNPRLFIAQRNGLNSVSLTNDGTIFHVADQYDVVVNTTALSGCTAQLVADGPTADLPLSLKLTCTTGGTPASGGYALIVPWYEGSDWAQLGFGTSGAQPISEACWVKANYTGSIGFGLVANSNDSRGYTPTHSSVTSGTWTRLVVSNIPGDTTGTWQASDGTLGAFAPHITPVAGSGVCTSSTNQWNASAGLCETGNQVSSVSNNFTFQVTGCQVTKGSVAPPLPISSYATDFNRAQRFVQCFAETTGPFCSGAATSTTAFGCMLPYRLKMDKAPTLDSITTVGDLSVYNFANSNVATASTLTLGTASRDDALLTGTVASGLTSATPYQIRATTALAGNVCLEANP